MSAFGDVLSTSRISGSFDVLMNCKAASGLEVGSKALFTRFVRIRTRDTGLTFFWK